MKNLTDIVKELIASKREDTWWDFKLIHHKSKVDLVHDLLCMANSRTDHDAYIIFGIEDKTFVVKGVKDDPNRRNQQAIVDILRNIRFAGGVRPRIEMHTLEIDSKEIDVLIIKDTLDVPYYLDQSYPSDKNVEKDKKKIVNQFHIYTRVADNNTSINKNADINDIEYLWRKRFGINLAPKERMEHLLKDLDKWTIDWGNKKYAYHINAPEYQLVLSDEMKEAKLPVSAFYTDSLMHTAILHIKYHSAVLYETEIWIVDQFRKYIPKANIYAHQQDSCLGYAYYLLDSIEGKLLNLFTNGSCDISSREPNYHQILIFKDSNEKELFDSYLEEHYLDYSDDAISKEYTHQISVDVQNGSYSPQFNAVHVAKCGKLYADWRTTISAADQLAGRDGVISLQ